MTQPLHIEQTKPSAARPPAGLLDHRPSAWGVCLLLLFLLLLPPALKALGEDFYVGVASRVLVYALDRKSVV